MKSYSEHINDINADEVFDGLVGQGLFSDKIPDFLESDAFANYFLSLSYSDNKWRDYVRYESMRNINVPRQLAIQHPFAYGQLCEYIKTKWTDLQAHFTSNTAGHTHKVSRIHLRKREHGDGLFQMNYKNFEEDGWPENDLIIKSKYLVHADISNCFGSIYTHAIAWSLAGKAVAKTKAGMRASNWYNELDKFVRVAKNGETNGIVIGPHASNLISEIVLVKVDKALYDKGYKYIRNIDDYQCYVKNRDEADQFLLDLSTELKEYELTLNHKKTAVLELPIHSEKLWLRTLRRFIFDDKNPDGSDKFISTKVVFSYLDQALELMGTEGESQLEILNYAIKILSSKSMHPETKSRYLQRVHHLVLVYPYLIQLLDEHVFDYVTSVDKIHEISNDIMEMGLEKRIYEPCIHALFFAIKYDFELNESNIDKKAIASNDCLFMLLAFLYLKSRGEDVSDLERAARGFNTEAKFDQQWLFVYEVLPVSLLRTPFKEMKQAGISFVKKAFRKSRPKKSGRIRRR